MFDFDQPVTLSHLLTFGAVIFAAIGLLLTANQMKVSDRARRASNFLALLADHLRDEKIRRMVYKLDYKEFKFDKQIFRRSEDEQALDRLLYNYDLIGHQLKFGLVTKAEVKTIAYEIQRVLDDPHIKAYLDFIDGESTALEEEHKLPKGALRAFPNARDLRNKIIAPKSRIDTFRDWVRGLI